MSGEWRRRSDEVRAVTRSPPPPPPPPSKSRPRSAPLLDGGGRPPRGRRSLRFDVYAEWWARIETCRRNRPVFTSGGLHHRFFEAHLTYVSPFVVGAPTLATSFLLLSGKPYADGGRR